MDVYAKLKYHTAGAAGKGRDLHTGHGVRRQAALLQRLRSCYRQ